MPLLLPLWKAATEAMVVHPSTRLLKYTQSESVVRRVLPLHKNGLRSWAHALRVHQWLKNLLLFLPLLLAHKIFESQQVLLLLCAFASFSLCASSVYILNDLLDLEFDRHHPRKKLRPFAAGTLPISTGIILIPLLFGSSFLIALTLLPSLFAVALGLYVALTTAYSFYVKRLVIIDVLVLAGLYTLRVFSGAIAVNVYVTPWLLAFSIFLFLSLALVKRYSELTMVPDSSEPLVNGRGYHFTDRNFLLNVGVVSGYLSLLIFTLYVSSHEIKSLYQNAQYLWFICPLFLYWITRVWFLTYRDLMVDDPLVFTLKDPVSYAVGGLIGLIILTAL
jgi:4-hydroxybenzoate polyprenyltransferase